MKQKWNVYEIWMLQNKNIKEIKILLLLSEWKWCLFFSFSRPSPCAYNMLVYVYNSELRFCKFLASKILCCVISNICIILNQDFVHFRCSLLHYHKYLNCWKTRYCTLEASCYISLFLILQLGVYKYIIYIVAELQRRTSSSESSSAFFQCSR